MTANVYKGDANIRPNKDHISVEDERKFKTFYFLLKSKKLEQALTPTSLTDYSVETS